MQAKFSLGRSRAGRRPAVLSPESPIPRAWRHCHSSFIIPASFLQRFFASDLGGGFPSQRARPMSSKCHEKHRRTEDRDVAAEFRPAPDNLSAGEAGDGMLRREFLQQAATGGIATAG